MEAKVKLVTKKCPEQLPRGMRTVQFAKLNQKLIIIFSEESSLSCKTGARKIFTLVPKP